MQNVWTFRTTSCFIQVLSVSVNFDFKSLCLSLFMSSLINRIEPSSCNNVFSMYTTICLASYGFFPIVHLTLNMNRTYATKLLLQLTHNFLIDVCKI